MNHYPTSIRQVIRQFSKLPGIGEKTAERLAMYILRSSRSDAEQLARSISELKDKVRLCSICFSLSEAEHCSICSNPSRDDRLLCVVEQPADMVSIEKSGAYIGKYHVLQGALSPMDGIGPDAIRIKELIARIAAGKIQEVILATGTHVEGEATASYLLGLLEKFPIKITRIASGVPIGGDLKYIDQITLKRAMETRYAL
jgi:recombination protein RecR